MKTQISEETIEAIAELAADEIQTQYPKVDYLHTTVKNAVIDAAHKVLTEEKT